MEQRRFILFLTLSMLVLFGWINFVIPVFFPPVPQQVAQPEDGEDEAGGDRQPDKIDLAQEDQEEDVPVKGRDEGKESQPTEVNPIDAEKPVVAEENPEFVEPPNRTVRLGSLDPESGYFFLAKLNSRGAVVENLALNDPRYRELKAPNPPLKVLGNTTTEFRSLATAVHQIDGQLAKYSRSLNDVEWELASTKKDRKVITAATFRFISPDGNLEVQKRYYVEKISNDANDWRETRDTKAAGYLLHFDLSVINHGKSDQAVSYELQGPVGLPLENAAHTRKFRDIKMKFLNQEEADLPELKRGGDAESLTVGALIKAVDNDKVEEWKRPIKYIGIDVQYFAALVIPAKDQLKDSYVAVAKPMLIDRKRKEKGETESHSDMSVLLQSPVLTLKPGTQVTHSYLLFAGPKRQQILQAEQIRAADILDFGWFGFVSKAMLNLLTFFHISWGIPYGIAIIFLTIMVRGCMYPLSRKQAAGAKKMKELQPKISELRKKHGKDKEKMARAQMELFSKHNYNPLAGCLPVFVQLPIFLGLYRALNNSVDLRMAPFLWFDNLAAPDALMRLPFQLPFLGHEFNLLPIITVILFVVQQKMFMPPPTDDQQAMQHKMMKYMMVFMGFMFYHVPAGLCVYFIASSLWGLGERKMLDLSKDKPATDDPAPPQKNLPNDPPGKKGGGDQPKNGGGGFFGKLLAAADAAQQQKKSNGQSGVKSDRKKSKPRR